MSEFVKRDDVLGILHELGGCDAERGSWSDGWDQAIDTAYDRVKGMDAVDMVPVRYGAWEEIRSVSTGEINFRCSACKRYRFHNGEMLRKYKYCPLCGAKMDGDGNE